MSDVRQKLETILPYNVAYELYVIQGIFLKDLCIKFGFKYATLQRYFSDIGLIKRNGENLYEIKNCKKCNKEFRSLRRRNQKFCSKICADSIKRIRKGNSEQERLKKELSLEQLKELYINRNKEIKEIAEMYNCQKEDMWSYIRSTGIKKERTCIIKCKNCGKEVKSQMKRKRKYCSKECQNKDRVGKKLGTKYEYELEFKELKQLLNREEAYNLFVLSRKTIKELSVIFDCDSRIMSYFLTKYLKINKQKELKRLGLKQHHKRLQKEKKSYSFDEKEAEIKYVNGGMTQIKLAEYLGCSYSEIKRFMRELRIEKGNRQRILKLSLIITEETLRHLLLTERLTMVEIGKKYNISPSRIKLLIKYYGLVEDFNKLKEIKKAEKRNTYMCDGCGKEFEGLISENRGKKHYCSFDCMRKNSPVKRERIYKKCLRCGKKISYRVTDKIIPKFCSQSCFYAHNFGEEHYQWVNGWHKDYTKKFRNERFKQIVRDYYGNICLICGSDNNGRGLCIHHIDYDKKNDNFYNFAPICSKCHQKTNYNREYWAPVIFSLVISYNINAIGKTKFLNTGI